MSLIPEDEYLEKIIEDEFEWSNRNNKAVRFHTIIGKMKQHIDQTILEEPNQLLRSAYQIAKRRGEGTNWEAFEQQLKLELEREHQIMHSREVSNDANS